MRWLDGITSSADVSVSRVWHARVTERQWLGAGGSGGLTPGFHWVETQGFLSKEADNVSWGLRPAEAWPVEVPSRGDESAEAQLRGALGSARP